MQHFLNEKTYSANFEAVALFFYFLLSPISKTLYFLVPRIPDDGKSPKTK
jgi:hypothetical protein